MGLITKIFGTYSERQVKKIIPIVDRIEALADEYKAKTDEQLREMTNVLKARLAKGETTDDILPEAFATVREAACSANARSASSSSAASSFIRGVSPRCRRARARLSRRRFPRI